MTRIETPHGHIAALFPGPVDVIGDIHGEIDALRGLVGHLGYDGAGIHPQGRRLVFVGDLCDRGPDSPSVFEFVAGLVERELAQCILGNHELNLLREAAKDGNGWYFPDDHDAARGHFNDSRRPAPADRSAIASFIASLPLALEREDLRIVHAAWDAPSIAACRHARTSVLDVYCQHEKLTKASVLDSGLDKRAASEKADFADRLKDSRAEVPLLSSVATLDELLQAGNPVRLVTSGIECAAMRPFFASGQWRMTDRVAWWETYDDPVPVLFGHYWRWPSSDARSKYSRGEPDLFSGSMPNQMLGVRRNAFCVDFAVGVRHKERSRGANGSFECRLGAVRWPERRLMFDDGQDLALF